MTLLLTASILFAYTTQLARATLTIDTASADYLTEEEEGEGEGRLGFISVGSNGATSLAFNATSIQAIIYADFRFSGIGMAFIFLS